MKNIITGRKKKYFTRRRFSPHRLLREDESARPPQKPTTSTAKTTIHDDALPDSPTSVDNSVHEYDPVVEMADFNSLMSRLPNK